MGILSLKLKKLLNLLFELKVTCSLQNGKFLEMNLLSLVLRLSDCFPKKVNKFWVLFLARLTRLSWLRKFCQEILWYSGPWKILEKHFFEKYPLKMLLPHEICSSHMFIYSQQQHAQFADDNTLSVCDISAEQIIHRIQHDLDILQTWFLHNGMLLNETTRILKT